MKKTISHHQKNKSNNLTVMGQKQEIYSGPIPPPRMLTEYENIQKGFAERIISMAERQSAHRQNEESKYSIAQQQHIERRDIEAKRGQIFALAFGIIIVISSVIVITRGYPISGSILGSLAPTTIITAFIYGRKKDK